MCDITTNTALGLIVTYHEVNGISNALRRINKTIWSNSEEIPAFKSYVNLVTLGGYHSGKSAVVGRLVLDSGSLVDKQMVRSLDATYAGLESMDKYIYVTDRTKMEREQARTIEVSRCLAEFKRHYVAFINVPGHTNLVKNRICGAVQADHFLYVIDATAWHERTMIECRQTLRLIKAYGAKTIVIAVNKMDAIEEGKQTFHAICEFVRGCSPIKDLTIVPVSAKTGHGLAPQAEHYGWYSGPSLYDAIDALRLPKREIHKPLRIVIDRSYQVRGVGTVLTGTIVQGVIRVGQHVKLGPINRIVHVRSLHLAVEKQPIAAGYPGQYVGLNIPFFSKKLDISHKRMGLVTGYLRPSDKEQYNPKTPYKAPTTRTYDNNAPQPKTLPVLKDEQRQRQKDRQEEAPMHPVESFVARVCFFGVENGKSYSPQGELSLHTHTGQCPVRIDQIIKYNPLTTKNIDSLPHLADGARGDMSALSYDTMVQEILCRLPAIELLKTLPLVCQAFHHLTYCNDLWEIMLRRDDLALLPLSVIASYRALWQHNKLKTMKNDYSGNQRLQRNDTTLVTLHAKGKPLAVDTFLNCPPLGRIFLRQGWDVVAAGIVVDTTFGKEANEQYWAI